MTGKSMGMLAAAAVLAAASGSAMAAFTPTGTDTFDRTFDPMGGAVTFAGTVATLGTITLDVPSTVTFTFLGREAAYTDTFTAGGMSFTNKSVPIGYSISFDAAAGLLDFSFSDKTGAVAANGEVFDTTSPLGWGVLEGATSSYGAFDYIVGFNDTAPHKDFDDMLIGITVMPVSAVPEPETYAMMLAGLGGVGLVAYRRRRQ